MSDLLLQLIDSIGTDSLGVEIGAHSLPVAGVRPYYLDRTLQFAGSTATIDIQSDALTLPLPNACVDYLCSSHVLEHLVNPTFGLLEWHRVLRPGGLLYLIVPDQRYTFDRTRPVTNTAHLREEFLQGTLSADASHIREFIYGIDWTLIKPATPVERHSAEKAAHYSHYIEQISKNEGVDVHFHTFTPSSLHNYLRATGIIGQKFHLLGAAERYPAERGDGIGLLLRRRGTHHHAPAPFATYQFTKAGNPRRPLPLVCPATLQPLTIGVSGSLETSGSKEIHRYNFENGVPNLLVPSGTPVSRPWSRKFSRHMQLVRASITNYWPSVVKGSRSRGGSGPPDPPESGRRIY